MTERNPSFAKATEGRGRDCRDPAGLAMTQKMAPRINLGAKQVDKFGVAKAAGSSVK